MSTHRLKSSLLYNSLLPASPRSPAKRRISTNPSSDGLKPDPPSSPIPPHPPSLSPVNHLHDEMHPSHLLTNLFSACPARLLPSPTSPPPLAETSRCPPPPSALSKMRRRRLCDPCLQVALVTEPLAHTHVVGAQSHPPRLGPILGANRPKTRITLPSASGMAATTRIPNQRQVDRGVGRSPCLPHQTRASQHLPQIPHPCSMSLRSPLRPISLRRHRGVLLTRHRRPIKPLPHICSKVVLSTRYESYLINDHRPPISARQSSSHRLHAVRH